MLLFVAQIVSLFLCVCVVVCDHKLVPFFVVFVFVVVCGHKLATLVSVFVAAPNFKHKNPPDHPSHTQTHAHI